MPKTEVVLLNDHGLARRTRTSARGAKVFYTVEIEAEPIVHQFDGLEFGKAVAESIKEALQGGLRGIGELVSPATDARRKKYREELNAGEAAATKRYAGGRTGRKDPAQTSRFWLDSLRFLEGLVVTENKLGGGWTVNVPQNRLDPSTFGGGAAALSTAWKRLVSIVPIFGNPSELAKVPGVSKSIDNSIAEIIVNASRRGAVLRGQLVRTALGALGGRGGRLVGNLLTLHLP